MHPRIIFALLWLIPSCLAATSPSPMQAYTVDLPGHTLCFSFPVEIVRNMPPDKIAKNFDPNDPSFQRTGFQELGRWLHDFNGPFWVGAYGSLRFHFMIRHIDEKFRGKITTPIDLESYLRRTIDPKYGFAYEQTVLNGVSCARRFYTTFGEAAASGKKREELEIFSFPLNEQIFLEIGFNIMEWVPGKTTSWKANAEELRDTIKKTIVLDGITRSSQKAI